MNSHIKIGNNCLVVFVLSFFVETEISDGSIVAYKSLLTKIIIENNLMVTGISATIKRHNVE